MKPEQQARQKIDVQLFATGWIVQDYAKMDLSAGRGVAISELPFNSGRCDYLPLPDEQMRILYKVGRRPRLMEDLEAVVSANRQRATRLRQSVLQKSFTGNL
jgi:hypothetical protein